MFYLLKTVSIEGFTLKIETLLKSNHYVNLIRKWQSKTPINEESCHEDSFKLSSVPDIRVYWAFALPFAIKIHIKI